MKLSMFTILDWLKNKNYNLYSNIEDDTPFLAGIRLGQEETKNEFLHIHSFDQIQFNIPYHTIVSSGKSSIFLQENDIPAIYDEISNAFSYYNDWERGLLFALINGGNLNELLEIAHNVFQRPMFIKGDSSWAYAATPGYDNSVHPDWVKIERSILNRTADFDAIKTVSLDANFQLAFTQKYPIIIKSPFYGGNVLRTNVWVDKQRLCEIIILEDTKPFNQGEIHLLQVFSQFIENYVRKNRSEFLTISDISILFIQMLESNVADTLKFKHIRNALNWEIEEFLVVLCVESHATCETPLLGVLRDTLSHQLKSSCVFSYHDHIVSIINVQKNGGYTALVQKIEQLVPSGSYTWGISYEFSRLEKTVKFYQQSLYVLNIAKEISKPRATMYEVAYYCMQKEVKKLPDLQTFVHPALRTLKENDKIKDTNYFITLYEFLLCGNNYTNAANHLNLHRNSLIYRISRIQEIINIDLYNKDNVKLLLLSYLILEEVIN